MRLARKLTLLATLAVAALAVAPSALAQEPLAHNQVPRLAVAQEVHAASDAACPAITPSPAPPLAPLVTGGGCRLHFSGSDIELYAHLNGGLEVLVSTCDVEFDVRIDNDGEGYVSHQEFTQPTDPLQECSKKACGQVTPPTSEGRAYSFFLEEFADFPTETATLLFCTENLNDTGLAHCEVVLPMSQTSLHRYRFRAQDVSAHGIDIPHCELGGQGGSSSHVAIFDMEATLGTTGEGQTEQRIEIRHT